MSNALADRNSSLPPLSREEPPHTSGTQYKVVSRPATVGLGWHDVFHPGISNNPPTAARVQVVADVVGALTQIHSNTGIPTPHRRHGRVTPRHILIGLDGSASLVYVKEPFGKVLPPQPDLGYLAPEILERAGDWLAHTDVFAAGVLLWEALDNGRLFPHRQSAAISRLIARQSLPEPRVDVEWAHPLVAVAKKALSAQPNGRYPDATAFWRDLRQHLPPSENARASLSGLVQKALQLEVAGEVHVQAEAHQARMDSATPAESQDVESGARYSLRPPARNADHTDPTPGSVHSRRKATRATGIGASSPRTSGTRTKARSPSQAPSSRSAAPPSPQRASDAPSAGGYQREAEERVSTLEIRLPPDLIRSSLAYGLSSAPPETRSGSTWMLVALAALAFFGVGAAAAFGAVAALRGPSPASEASSAAAKPPPPLPVATEPSLTTPTPPPHATATGTSTPAPHLAPSTTGNPSPSGPDVSSPAAPEEPPQTSPPTQQVNARPRKQARRKRRRSSRRSSSASATKKKRPTSSGKTDLPFVSDPF